MTASYNTLTPDNPDIGYGHNYGWGNAVTNTLGPDGLPVEKSTGLYSDVNPVTDELLWWTPNAYVLPGTTYSWPTTVTLPFDIQSKLFPNGPGGMNGDDVGYISTHLSATFTAPAGGSVTFTLGSDDDAFIYLNGVLVVDNAGIHALQSARLPSTTW